MGNKWITKEEVERIKDTYAETERRDGKASILKTAAALNLSTVKVRRVLITEGLWSSKSSVEIGAYKAAGMSTVEIAEKLHMTEKNVQAYMPYEGGVYGVESQNAVDSRRSRDKARGKDNTEGEKSDMEATADEITTENESVGNGVDTRNTDVRKMMKYAVDYGKMLLLIDESCTTENGLPVVRTETIEAVRSFERELFEKWQREHKTVSIPDPFDYPLVDGTEEDKQKLEEYHRLDAEARDAENRERGRNPFYGFTYIDCAPEALNYASPGMPDRDYWLWPELIDKANMKAEYKTNDRRMKKLTFSQFIDRLSTCVSGGHLDGSAYEKTLKTQVELLRRKETMKEISVLVFVNFHLLCDRSGGKNSKYTSVGDMIGITRQIWDSTGVPMLFLSSDKIIDVLSKDDEGRKLQWRVSGVRV